MKNLLLTLALPLLGAAPAGEGKPNILFILTDDHRPDGMGCYGNTAIRTPHFDSIAREGARFDRFYVAAPLCCPSRAAFLSGLYPHQTNILTNGGNQSFSTPSIAHALAKEYVTGFIGKAHVPAKRDPATWGFEEAPLWLRAGYSEHQDPTLVADGVRTKVPGLVTKLFTDAALSWIEKHKSDRWFLWFATTAPHVPYIHDPEYPYAKADVPPPPMWPPGTPLSDHERETGYNRRLFDWARYYSTISMLDAQVGRILAKLRDLGLLDSTLVFVAGDNGMMLDSHGYDEKWVWYEESARVPALARWPRRIKPGTVVPSPAVSVDLYPTLCEVAGVELPIKTEAASLLPALTGGEPRRRLAYAECKMESPPKEQAGRHWQMVRAERYKYARFLDTGEEQLHDLRDDPHELRNLAPDPAHAATLEEMRRLREAWLEKTP